MTQRWWRRRLAVVIGGGVLALVAAVSGVALLTDSRKGSEPTSSAGPISAWGDPLALAADDEAVWVLFAPGSGGGTKGGVARVDEEKGTVEPFLDVDADALAVGAGSLWLATDAGERTVRVDAGTGRVTATAVDGERDRYPPEADGPAYMAASDPVVWVALPGVAVAVDPATNQVRDHQGYPRESPSDVVAERQGVWLALGSHGVMWVDLDSTVQPSPTLLTQGDRYFAADDIVRSGDAIVAVGDEVEPTSPLVGDGLRVVQGPPAMASTGERFITTTAVDGLVVRSVLSVGASVEHLAEFDGIVYALSTEGEVFRVGGARLERIGTVPAGSDAFLAAHGSLWVLHAERGTLTKFDPDRGTAREIRLARR